MPKQPNIVLIFAEGLSQNIVDDDREIMPYVKNYADKSLFFKNYYNQTAATYRGLSAQLYSGFQFQNYDKNELISIQDILENEGYDTTFINAEPENAVFSKYLHDMDFTTVVSNKQDEYKGYSNTLSDKEIYDLLFETIETQSSEDTPLFTVVYTYGTHVSLDSIDEKFGDGSNPELNKFYDMDCQFGKFMEKFNRSKLSENTIIIFTTDHCTYNDDAFANTFPEIKRDAIFFDQVPFFIYYKGIKPEVINADGRTSVNLVPTILDYLDISEANYFLGDSLFSDGDDEKPLERYYIGSGADYHYVKDGRITEPTADEVEEISHLLERYYALKLTPLN